MVQIQSNISHYWAKT